MSSRSWREDQTPLQRLVVTYRNLDEAAAPRSVEAARRQVRLDAEEEFLSAATGTDRLNARVLLRAAKSFVPLRETGKAAFVQGLDGIRAAARSLGAELTTRGLAAPDDVFYLTFAELTGTLPDDVADVVALRRKWRDEHLGVSIPEEWTGQPEPISVQPADDARPLTGIGASPGVTEGVVRVAVDPVAAADLEPGEILVCEFTDPGWAAAFFVAGAVVIDIGGMLSHGAIVARELGIPCVIGTHDGSRRLRSGQRVRVDGTVGSVEVLLGP